MKKIFLILVFSLVAAIGNSAQTPPPSDEKDEILKISTTLIQLDVVVTDDDGNPVADLKPEDFEVYENGKKQEITNFSFITSYSKNAAGETVAPPVTTKKSVPVPSAKLKAEQVRRTYAIVVDDLGLSFSSIYWVQQSLKKFVNEQMQDGDLVAIIRTGGGIGALQSFTSDKRQLLAAIDKVKWNAQGRVGIASFAPLTTSLKEDIEETQASRDGDGVPPVGIKEDYFFEKQAESLRAENVSRGTFGALKYVISGMRDLPGRKAMMFFSEGFQLTYLDTHEGAPRSRELTKTTEASDRIREVADWANRASVVIYTFDPRGLEAPGMLQANDAVTAGSLSGIKRQDRARAFTESQQSLRYLAYESGGLPFVNLNDPNLGMQRALADQKSYYLLGYQPDEETFDPKKNKYNRMEIKVKRSGLKVRYRSGFFGRSDEEIWNPAQTPREKLASALTSPFGADDVNLSLYPIYWNDATGGGQVQALVYIDAKDLQFTEEKGTHKANFDILAMTFGDNGDAANQIFKNYTIEASDRLYQSMLTKGFVYKIVVPMKKSGAYQFRVALRDTLSNKIGAASQFIEVPDFGKKLLLSQMILDNYTTEEFQKIRLGGDNASERSPLLDTALRQFRRGTILRYDYEVYNPKQSKSLIARIRLIHNGKVVYENAPAPVKYDEQNDLTRLPAYGALTLGKNLEAGDYILQTIVVDATAKEKNAFATQFVQFEVTE